MVLPPLTSRFAAPRGQGGIDLEHVDRLTGGGEAGHAGGVGGDGVGQRAGLSLLDLQGAGGVVVRGESGEDDGQRLLSGESEVLVGAVAVGGHADRVGGGAATGQGEIALRGLEVVEEAVLKDIDLVDIDLAPEIGAMVADVANFEHGVAGQFALDADVPALHVAGFEIGVEISDGVAGGDGQREAGRGGRGA